MSDVEAGDDYEPGDINSREEAAAERVLTYLAKQIVDDPDSVEVDVEHRRGVTLRLHVAPDDMGKIIGKRGRVVQSIRQVVRAAGARDGQDVDVDVVD